MAVRRASWAEGFGYEMKSLQDLMNQRGVEGIQHLNDEFGGLQELARGLKTNTTEGLSGDEADLRHRRDMYGANVIPAKKAKSFLELAWEALHDFTLIVLIVAAAISIILGLVVEKKKETAWIDGFAILVAVIVVVLVTAFNDYSKELQFQSLQKQIKQDHQFAVLRNGEIVRIPVTEIVVGDIISFKYGDALPTDGVLIQGNDVRVDESSMTGENDYIRKGPNRDVIMLSSTRVMEGSGKILVCAVGINSQAGIIFTLINKGGGGRVEKDDLKKEASGSDSSSSAGELDELTKKRASVAIVKEQEDVTHEKSVLQNKLTKLAVQIGYCGTIAALLSMFVIILRFCITTYVVDGKSWEGHHAVEILEGFIIGVTVLVVAIPEGLPLAVTIALAYSVKKMMLDNNLVRHLHACETMGNATAICSDKTGTLTTNRMTVVQSYLGKNSHGNNIKRDGLGQHLLHVLCDGVAINSGYSSRILEPEKAGEFPKQAGNKTECALLQFCNSLGGDYEQIREQHTEETFTKVFTFNSMRKSMTTVIPLPDGQGYRVFTKGASEIVLGMCSYILGAKDELYPLSRVERRYIVGTVVETLAKQGLRTLCLAYKDVSPDAITSDEIWDDELWVTSDLVCIGIVGIEDPVRDEVPAAIEKVQNAGVTVRMVTGDNINTAQAIATKCGILLPSDNKELAVLSGKEFNKRVCGADGEVDQERMDAVWPTLRVLARSSPEDKHTLVTGIIKSELSKHREVVAVTGDGTNDGPALKAADVGFAMGIAGTDVAKEASDIVLTDDNFASIVKAVMWGRNVYDSIAKFIQFQLTVNVVAVTLVFISACTIQHVPLTPIQMLWVNLIMDSLASLALATEPPTEELLTRKPYGRTKPLISRTMFRNIAMHSIFQLVVVFVLVFAGAELFNIDSAIDRADDDKEPTQHFTIVFNTFVMMQIFNEINARKVHGERNVFKGIMNNRFFVVIIMGTMALQILIVEYGSVAFSTKSLTADQWLWCVFLGMASLVWGQVVITVPKHPMPQFGKQTKDLADDDVDTVRDAKILWMRGLWRLQAQIRVVHAFRAAIESQHTPKSGSLRKSSDLMYPSQLHTKLREAQALEEGTRDSSADVGGTSNDSFRSSEPLVDIRVHDDMIGSSATSLKLNSVKTETEL